MQVGKGFFVQKMLYSMFPLEKCNKNLLPNTFPVAENVLGSIQMSVFCYRFLIWLAPTDSD